MRVQIDVNVLETNRKITTHSQRNENETTTTQIYYVECGKPALDFPITQIPIMRFLFN